MKTINKTSQINYILHFGDLSDEKFTEMIDYCRENKLSLVGTETCNLDVSDVSGRYDTIAVFKFLEESDALVMKLKFQ